MSDHIPFDIQLDIIKRLLIKSLIQFRSVSQQWKSFIDNPEFINSYHINHTNPQHHLLGSCYKLDKVQTYTSITYNNTFPQQKVSLTAPEPLNLLGRPLILSSVDGLLCFYGDVDSKTQMAIIWNPTIRKFIGFVIPAMKYGYVVVGLGICRDTSDPKLVKIIVDHISSMWVIEVFTLSTRAWKTVYKGAPFFKTYCDILARSQVFVNGVIYFLAIFSFRFKSVISFDFKSEKFGEVCLPERLVHTSHKLDVTKVNESLGLLEYHDEVGMKVCGVWSRKDGANNLFTKIYTLKIEVMGLYTRVLEFRNNGGVVIELMNDDNDHECRIEVYNPSSGHFNGVGINGKRGTIYARSYTETLLLLDESDSIIRYNDDILQGVQIKM